VVRGAAELAVIGENTAAEGLHTVICDIDELVLLLPPGHALIPADPVGRVPLQDLLQHDLVAFGRSTSLTRQLAAAAEAVHQPLRLRAQVRSFDAMGRMVAAGLGLAVLPRQGAAPYAHALGLHIASLQGLDTQRRLLMAMRDPATLSGAADALVKMAQQRLQALGFVDVQVQPLDAAVLSGFARYVRQQSDRVARTAWHPDWRRPALTARLIGPSQAAGLGYVLLSARKPFAADAQGELGAASKAASTSAPSAAATSQAERTALSSSGTPPCA
jgi:hypothetical protein